MVLAALGFVVGSCFGQARAANAGNSTLTECALLVTLGLLGARLVTAGKVFCQTGRFAMGLALGWLCLVHPGKDLPQEHLGDFDRSRPVLVEGDVRGCWSQSESGMTVSVAVDRAVQGDRVVSDRTLLMLGIERLDRFMPLCGGRIAAKGYLAPVREFRNEPRVRVGGLSLWVKSGRLIRWVESPRFWSRWAEWIRHRLRSGQERGTASSGERLARTLALGDRGAIDPRWKEGFRRLGLSHILVVSGLHLGLMATLVGWICLGRSRKLRLLAVLFVCGNYGLVVGPQASVLRALAMIALVSLAMFVKRPPQLLNTLCVSVIVLLLTEPDLLMAIGFQLSVAATAGILILSPGIGAMLEDLRRWGSLRLGRYRRTPGARILADQRRSRGEHGGIASALRRAVSVSIAAQIATAPWTIGLFHWWSPLAPLWNLLAIPWVVLSLVVSMGWVVTGLLSPALAEALVTPLLDLLAIPCTLLAELGPGFWGGAPIVVATAELLVAVASLCWWSLRPKARSLRLGLPLVALVSILLGLPSRALSPASAADRSMVSLTMLDVGQGDALLLTGGGSSILVDGGGWKGNGFGARVLTPALAAQGIKRLSMAVITHADLDHCGGVADAIRLLPIERLVVPAGWRTDTVCAQAVSAYPGRIESGSLGDRFVLGGWSFLVLSPSPARVTTSNSGSLVLRAEAAGRCLLLTGDIDGNVEQEMRAEWGDEALKCDFLKIAHHGARSSTTPGFLHAVEPQLALISSGRRNRYGHPTPSVLRRLENRRIWTLRTDREGAVRLRWNSSENLFVTLQ